MRFYLGKMIEGRHGSQLLSPALRTVQTPARLARGRQCSDKSEPRRRDPQLGVREPDGKCEDQAAVTVAEVTGLRQFDRRAGRHSRHVEKEAATGPAQRLMITAVCENQKRFVRSFSAFSRNSCKTLTQATSAPLGRSPASTNAPPNAGQPRERSVDRQAIDRPKRRFSQNAAILVSTTTSRLGMHACVTQP